MMLSLRDVFDGQHPVAEIRGDSPTQDYALLRLLLAIFWMAHRPESDTGHGGVFDMEEWADDAWDAAQSGAPDASVLTYLERFAPRFDLLHPSTPFMQTAQLRTSKDSQNSVARIVPEAENDYFTMRDGAGRRDLSLAEAARWVVHTQAYDYSGIKSGAVGDSRVKGGKGYPIGQGWTGLTGGTMVVGRTLSESLVLNTTAAALRGSPEDLPPWEREPDGPAERPDPFPQGAVDLLTWQSRRVRLFSADDRVTGVLVCNGDRIPDAGANIMADPMTPYRYSANKSTRQKPVHYPRPHDPDRTVWRSLEPLLSLQGDLPLKKDEKESKRPEVLNSVAALHSTRYGTSRRVVNLRLISTSYGPQASSASTGVDARISVPLALLQDSPEGRQAVLEAGRATRDVASQLGIFAGQLLQAAGGDYEFRHGPANGLLHDLEPEFTAWIAHLDPAHVPEQLTQWQRQVSTAVRDHAQALLRGAGPRALLGREATVNDRTVLVTAGTAHSRLLRELRKRLPLAHGLIPDASKETPPAPLDETAPDLEMTHD